MIYPTREEYDAWIKTRPKGFFTTDKVCSDCLLPMDEWEILLRAIATMTGRECAIFTCICASSRMSGQLIDALIYITSGQFDIDKWDFSPDTIEGAIQNVVDEIPLIGCTVGTRKPAVDRLDWRAISTYQYLPKEYKRKRATFFRGNERIVDYTPYRHATQPEKKTKEAEWLE